MALSQGSIEQAVAQVEAFRGLLEHRVIARFDAAVAAGDLGGMAECARIMAEFRQGESQLVQVPASLFSPLLPSSPDGHCMHRGPAPQLTDPFPNVPLQKPAFGCVSYVSNWCTI